MFVKYNNGSNQPSIVECNTIIPEGGKSIKIQVLHPNTKLVSHTINIANVHSITDTMPDRD